MRRHLTNIDETNISDSNVSAVGSIKWRDRNPFDQRDLADLAAHRAEVPRGHDAPLIAMSRSGCTARDLAAVYSPDDLVSAWRCGALVTGTERAGAAS